MAKVLDGVVLCDDLFKQYHAFRRGKVGSYQDNTIKKLLKFYRSGFVSNIAQYERCGVPLDNQMKQKLYRNNMRQQSIVELANTHTLYKIVLSVKSCGFPYVNILSDDEKIDMSVTGSFNLREDRHVAIEHIAAICGNAREIILFDEYINNSKEKENIKDVLDKILPTSHEVSVRCYSPLSSEIKNYLNQKSPNRTFDALSVPNAQDYHDRYIVVDNKLEILLSSGLDHLARTISDLTYVVRPITENRFG